MLRAYIRLAAAVLAAATIAIPTTALANPGQDQTCPHDVELFIPNNLVLDSWIKFDTEAGTAETVGLSLDWDGSAVNYSVDEDFVLDLCVKSGTKSFDGVGMHTFVGLTGEGSVSTDFGGGKPQDISHIAYRLRRLVTPEPTPPVVTEPPVTIPPVVNVPPVGTPPTDSVGGVVPPVTSVNNVCADFPTQEEAQAAMTAGQAQLDADHDGFACEALPLGALPMTGSAAQNTAIAMSLLLLAGLTMLVAGKRLKA